MNNIDIDVLQDMILLFYGDKTVPRDTITRWTDAQKAEVEKWVGKSLLRANDNPVRVPPVPAIIQKWLKSMEMMNENMES